MGNLHGALAQPLVILLEAFVGAIFVLPFMVASMHWLAYSRLRDQVSEAEPEQPAVNLETLEAFPYSLGRLARVLQHDAGLSPKQSGEVPRREEATEYLLVGVKPDKHKS